ncbi:MAG: N-6 DNA methylase [Cytophagales bacterium]|nr:N-6 DNA methylase [Cytophagales bacterium]
MSQLLINDYLKQLDLIKKISGSNRETIVREAFKDLLKNWGKSEKLVFIAEYPQKTAAKNSIALDGALLHELRMPLGYWEAKDADDKLDEEIEKKFKRGYPKDNIIFSDDITAVLWQNHAEVLRCAMTDTQALFKLLKLFFGFERVEIADFRAAVEQFKTDLPAVLQGLREMIDLQASSNKAYSDAATQFLEHAQEAINPILTSADVREMLIQHILTEEIFSKVFDSDFHRENNVAKELYALENVFFTGSLKKQTLKSLETYYAAIRAAAAQISSHSEKQTFLKVIYENFYKVYNAKAADRLGVVYTPNEIVRFMIDGADWLCETHFGKNLIDKNVEILDPATGTGTFICELLEHFRGQPTKLAHKYKNELHANEVAILPYYVANLNIEATYAAITGQYDEFPNLCFVDTLDNVGLHTQAKGTTSELFGSVSQENVARIKRQNTKKISVVIGNPPYNANQANENDNNKNREYPSIDARIKQTYIAESTAQKTKLYDMYARFFRWASDRLGDDGVLAFVTNRSFIESRTFDGFRKTVATEYSDIYVVDLGGDVRANPKLSGTKHNVFGIQTGVAISFMVKRSNADKGKTAKIHYVRRPEMETAEEKLSVVSSQTLRSMAFTRVEPDKTHNWLNITDNDFETFIPLINKQTKAAMSASKERAIFKKFALGVSTNRDEWVIDPSADTLAGKVAYFLDVYKTCLGYQADYTTRIKWSRDLKRKAERRLIEEFDSKLIGTEAYRPYVRQYIYQSNLLVDRASWMPHFPPGNKSICFTGPNSSKSFHALATTAPFGLDFLEKTYGVPNQTQNADLVTSDNITDWGLKQFKNHYQAARAGSARTDKKPITKKAIFHYCYAVLHNPAYREKYALNLKREFPRIPFYVDFWQWAAWGEALMQLHIGYEAVAPFKLKQMNTPDERVRAADLQPKVVLKANPAAGLIQLDSETTLSGVPPAAWAYKLGNRSALEWVLDQYKEKKPKDPTIRAKFDTYRFADYKTPVIDLLKRVTTVSVETVKITRAMAALSDQ